MAKPASIFISYRRKDADGHAGRLYDRLKSWFDIDDVFFDVQSIESGAHFPERIRHAVEGSRVVLVLISRDWIEEINRRATLPEVDFVRQEVELALQLSATNGQPQIIPVLFGGGSPPALADLHASLRVGMARLPDIAVHEFRGTNADWDHQFERLRKRIEAVDGVPPARYRLPAGVRRPFHLIGHQLSAHFRDPAHAVTSVRTTLLAEPHDSIVVPAVLHGMGGVGKTQLALKYSLDNRESYAGIWWFRAESDETLQLDASAACVEAGVKLIPGELPTTTFKYWLAE